MQYQDICQTKDDSGDGVLKLCSDKEFVTYFEQNTKQCLEWFGAYSDPQLKSVPLLISKSSDPVETSATVALFLLEAGLQPSQLAIFARVLGFLTVDNDKKTELIKPIAQRALTQATKYIADADHHDHVVVILARCLSIDKQWCETELDKLVDAWVKDGSELALRQLFETISFVFYIDASGLGKRLFEKRSIQEHNFNKQSFASAQVVTAAMEALSSACIDKECRTLVAQNFQTVVQQVFETAPSPWVQLLAASVVVKSAAGSSPKGPDDAAKHEELEANLQQLSELFEAHLEECSLKSPEELASDRAMGPCVESLAYTSLMEPVKQRLCETNELVLKTLVAIIKSPTAKNGSHIYCALTILANLTQYAPKLNAEQQKAQQLRDYANNQNTGPQKKRNLPSDAEVDDRNVLVSKSNIVSAISASCPKFSLTSKGVAATLLRNLATSPQNRPRIVQEGGLAALIYILSDTSASSGGSTSAVTSALRRISISALAKTLISTNPDLAFSSKLSPAVCVAPLLEQLQLSPETTMDGLPLLDVFEALMALTNLASSQNEQCRTLVMRNDKGFTQIETLLTTSSNAMIQRACLELICNLSMSPLCAEKYLDKSVPATTQRLELLAAFANSDDVKTATAASGALAILCEYGQIAADAMATESVVTRIVRAFGEQSSQDVSLRLFVVLEAILNTQQGATLVKSAAKESAKQVMTKVRRLGSSHSDMKDAVAAFEKLSI